MSGSVLALSFLLQAGAHASFGFGRLRDAGVRVRLGDHPEGIRQELPVTHVEQGLGAGPG